MAIVIRRNISKRMGAIVFEASMFAETGMVKRHEYSIPSRFGKPATKVVVEVEANIDRCGITRYNVELGINGEFINRTFDDIPPAVKFLTKEIAAEHEQNGHVVIL